MDEQIRVVLREHCPHCQGSVILRGAKPQYQEDILRADGAVAPAHRAGAGTGLWAEVEPCGVGRAWERLGNLAAPTCQRLPSRLPQSPVVWLDDTGWRVGAQPQNLRVLLSEQVTVYLIEPHRGYAEAAAISGEDYAGLLVPDGARCFYGLEQALHPSCLEHLIRRCREMIRMASPAAARFPLAVRRLLQQGLDLRDRYRQGSLSGHGLAAR